MSMEINVKTTNTGYNFQIIVNCHNFYVFIELVSVFSPWIVTNYNTVKDRARYFFIDILRVFV
jgi:hypothetical protein